MTIVTSEGRLKEEDQLIRIFFVFSLLSISCRKSPLIDNTGLASERHYLTENSSPTGR